ncbi:P-loop containing nucleoside triphosphate hydrolase protein [Pleurotus eryngii]|uniref:DNA 3'-5' helicase n=1 Tax=Pleurotus eryngii TaxID=5323 RepID=A0A9P5ZIN5_PLEER|nr:P-loop containing nucleoside triphosphate hydrolase protein [Pleurotus eryngii]
MSAPHSTPAAAAFKFPNESLLTNEDIRTTTISRSRKRPCQFQIDFCRAQLQRKNTISISPTGSGKTLTFLMPLFFSDQGITIVVTALNVLGTQFVTEAGEYGIPAISVTAANDNDVTFADIKALKYRLVIFNPEILTKRGGRCEKQLWTSKSFTSRLLAMVFDEAHCILKWGSSFRPEYAQVTNILHFLPSLPIYLLSATMPPSMIHALADHFCFAKDHLLFQRSNDRTNIHLAVRKMQYPQNSYHDLAFLIPRNWQDGDPIPIPFLVFFNSKKEAEQAALYLMSRVTKMEDFRNGEIWGLFMTDVGRMGLDLSHIRLVIQYKATDDLETMVQRFGRGGRDLNSEVIGLLLVEPKWFYEEQVKKEERKRKRQEKQVSGSRGAEPPRQVEEGDDSDEEGNEVGNVGPESRKASDAEVEEVLLRIDAVRSTHAENGSSSFHAARKAGTVDFTVRLFINAHALNTMLPACSDPLKAPPRATNKMKVPPFTPNAAKLELKRALLTWRDAEAQKRYYGTNFYGADLLMHSSIVDRIVELAHANQLLNAADLQNQTGWSFSGQCGADVIAIVLRFCPKPIAALPFAHDLLQVRTASADRPARAAPKPPTCQACGQVGHHSTSLTHLILVPLIVL